MLNADGTLNYQRQLLLLDTQGEDYKAASLLKQYLEQLQQEHLNSDPLLFLKTQLQDAVRNERYEVRKGGAIKYICRYG